MAYSQILKTVNRPDMCLESKLVCMASKRTVYPLSNILAPREGKWKRETHPFDALLSHSIESSGTLASLPSFLAAAISASRSARIGTSNLVAAARSVLTFRQIGSVRSANQRSASGYALTAVVAMKLVTVLSLEILSHSLLFEKTSPLKIRVERRATQSITFVSMKGVCK